jgi:hypothetical protein
VIKIVDFETSITCLGLLRMKKATKPHNSAINVIRNIFAIESVLQKQRARNLNMLPSTQSSVLRCCTLAGLIGQFEKMETATKRRKVAEEGADGDDESANGNKSDAKVEKERLRRVFDKFVSTQFEIMKSEVELPEDFDIGRIPREVIDQAFAKRAHSQSHFRLTFSQE